METRYRNSKIPFVPNSRPEAPWLTGAHMALYALTGLLVLSVLENRCSAAKPDPVSSAISRHFAEKTDYQPGDLISPGDFDQVLKLLEKSEVPVKRFTVLRERIPGNDSALQKLNVGKQGKAFLRKVGAIPGGYANAQDLASRPGGERTLKQLTRSRGGDKMIRYMATTKGGKELLSMTPGGGPRDAASPAPIYTAGDLRKAMLSVKLPAPS